MLTANDIDAIVARAARDGRHAEAATRFEELAGQPQQHGEDVTRATLLIDAGGQHALAGDWNAAIRSYREAIADGGATEPHVDPRVWLHGALLRTSQRDEAAAVLAQLKASRSRDPDLYTAVGESLEADGQLADAHTWFTMGYHRCRNSDLPDMLKDSPLIGRRRVRQLLGYPTDDLDTLADEYIAAVRALE
jgi:hypothetical protein